MRDTDVAVRMAHTHGTPCTHNVDLFNIHFNTLTHDGCIDWQAVVAQTTECIRDCLDVTRARDSWPFQVKLIIIHDVWLDQTTVYCLYEFNYNNKSFCIIQKQQTYAVPSRKTIENNIYANFGNITWKCTPTKLRRWRAFRGENPKRSNPWNERMNSWKSLAISATATERTRLKHKINNIR